MNLQENGPGGLEVINYNSQFTFDDLAQAGPDSARSLLEIYTGNNMSPIEASSLLKKIADHKWYVSERLSRDVGFHVAAIDFVENFYEPQSDRHSESLLAKIWKNVAHRTASTVRHYFEAKENTAH